MNFRTCSILVPLLLLLLLLYTYPTSRTPAIPTMSETRDFINGAYYPSWRVYRQLPPSALQLDCLNRVYYAFVLANEDGTLRFLDEYADCQISADGTTGCLSALSSNVKQQQQRQLQQLEQQRAPNNSSLTTTKALVSIGGGSGSKEFPALAAHSSSRLRFARACRELVDRFGLDGVDVDWEHPQSDVDGKNYVALLEAVRAELPAPRYELTTALPVGEYVLQHIDLARAAGSLDYLNLMCYDFNGPWTKVCGHQSKLFPLASSSNQRDIHPELRRSGKGAVEYVIARGFPARKIVLGIPAYARTFGGARGPGQPFQSSSEIDYVDLPREWVHGAKIDQSVGAAFYVDPCQDQGGKGFVTFDVPETVRRKAEYVKSQGLGGLFYWTGVGDIKGPESLVRAGYEALNT